MTKDLDSLKGIIKLNADIISGLLKKTNKYDTDELRSIRDFTQAQIKAIECQYNNEPQKIDSNKLTKLTIIYTDKTVDNE